MICTDRRKGVTCQLGEVRDDGVHPRIASPRHGGRDRRGVWHFWGSALCATELAVLADADSRELGESPR